VKVEATSKSLVSSAPAKTKPTLVGVAKSVFPDAFGGISRGVFEIANRLSDRGYSTVLLHLEKRDSRAYPQWRFVSEAYVRSTLLKFLPGDLHLAVEALIRYVGIGKKPCSQVLLSFHLLAGLLCSLRGSRSGVPIISFFAAPGFLDWLSEKTNAIPANSSSLYLILHRIRLAIGCRILRFLEHVALRYSSRILALSRYSFSAIEQYYPDVLYKSRVCYWGVDTETFRPARDSDEKRISRVRLGISTDGMVVACVRRLIPRMGVDLLLEAFSILSTRLDGAILLIAGDGPMRESLERRASELSCCERIIFLGAIPEDLLPSFYRAADVCVLPSLELEGLGLVTLESLACGVPVVGTSVGGIREVLSEVDPRCLVSTPDPAAVAGSLLEILTLPERERRLLIEKGYEVIRKLFAWDGTVNGIETCIRELS